MKPIAFLPVPLAIACLMALLPASALANRVHVRPHHTPPANWRKIVASTIRTVSYTGDSSSYSSSSSASFSAGTLSLSGGFVTAGAGTSLLTANSGYAGSTVVEGGTLTFNPSLLGSNNTSTGVATVGAGTLILNPGNLGWGGSNTGIATGFGTITIASAATLNVGNGVLTVTTGNLPDSATLSLGASGTMNLNFTGSDTIGQLVINGVTEPAGTWGSLASDAANKTDRITGTGTLIVTGPATTTAPAAAIIADISNPIASSLTPAPTVASGAAEAPAAPVPEPSSALLVLLGAGLVSQVRRRG